MIAGIATIFGAVIGASVALMRGGKPLDALQYAAGYGIAFALLGMLLTIIVDRNFLG